MARTVNNLGAVLEDLGDLVGAKKNYEMALQIFRKFLADNHPETVKTRENLDRVNALITEGERQK